MIRIYEMNNKRIAIYCRVSTRDQNSESQLLDLRKYCEARQWAIVNEFVDDGFSGTKSEDKRPALKSLMESARKKRFDLVLTWRFDRFARSTTHLLRSLEEFKHLGVDFVSFQENIDTSSPLGQALFTIVSAISQLERDVIVERVLSGLRRAKAKGKRLGRPRVAIDQDKLIKLQSKGLGLREIGRKLGVSKDSVKRLLEASQKPCLQTASKPLGETSLNPVSQ